jgi:GMP synthase (glutamine-hydrolysing)
VRVAALAGSSVAMAPYSALERFDADALVLSGSTDPWDSHDPAALERHHVLLRAFDGPVLGICAGMQNLVRALGGSVGPAARPADGFASVEVVDDSDLLSGCGRSFDVRKRHDDEVKELPTDFRLLATSRTCPVEAVAAHGRPWWGTQFHPEAWDDDHPVGRIVVERFLELAGIRP